MAPDQPFEPPIPVLAPAQAESRASVSLSFASWPLLNPYTARRARTLTLGLVGFRPLPERRESIGYSLAFGESVTTLRGRAFGTKPSFRWFNRLSGRPVVTACTPVPVQRRDVHAESVDQAG